MIHVRLHPEPLQRENFRSLVDDDPLFATSEKNENQNVSDCLKFIRSAVEAAAKFVKFAADQVASLYTEFSDRSALAPHLAKILLATERKGGTISVRDAQSAFNAKFRPTAQVTKLWFSELAALGYGKVERFGKSLIFQNTPRGDSW